MPGGAEQPPPRSRASGGGVEAELFCASCGAPLPATRRRPSLAALVAVTVVVVLAAGAAGFALSELTSDDAEDGATQTSDRPERTAPTAAPQQPTEAEERSARRRSLLLDWPEGLTAHTVVLVTSSDRPAALRLAREAARSGLEAGLLRADDYNLASGMWIVFAGRFDTRQGASRQAIDLAERFPGAYPQLIRPAG